MKHPLKLLIISVILIFSVLFISYAFVNNDDSVNNNTTDSISGYNLTSPEIRLELPEILHEISGLTDIDHNTIACIQDEEGLIFIYDLQKNEIKRQFSFHENGDYEGITRVGNTLYVLRSDGKLFEITDYESEDFQVNEYDTAIPVKNNEGLGYDPDNNRLLIAGKSKPKEDAYKGSKVVFAFDLDTKTISKKPVYEFSKAHINQFVTENSRDKSKVDEELINKIHPSAIAVHPLTGKLFVLSAKDFIIYIFNQKSEVEVVYKLDKKIFNKAEGITFFDNGDMLISNEGKEDKSTLLRFPYNNN